MALAVLSIDLEARLAKLEQGFDKAGRLAEQHADRSRAAWARAGAQVTNVAGLIASAFAGFSVVQFVRTNIDAVDSLNDIADATGASIENISALEDVAKRTGTTMETATAILVKFNAVLADAKPGSAQAEALKAIGLSAEALRKLDPAEALRVTAVALAKFADDGNKARLVQDLFGKSVREAAPFLKDLAEQGRLNAKVTAEQAEQAEKFNKQLFAFQAVIADVGRSIVKDMLPSLIEMGEQLRDARKEYGSFMDALLDQGLKVDPFKTLNENLTGTAQEIARVKKEIATTQSLRGGWFLGEDAADADLKDLREELRLLEARERVLRQRQLREGGGRGSVTPLSTPATDKPSVGAVGAAGSPKKQEISEAAQALARYVEQMERELEKTVELTEEQRALNLLKSMGSTGEIPQVRELVLSMAKRVQQLKAEEELEKGITEVLKQQADQRKKLDDQLEEYSGRVDAARKRALTDRLEKRLNAGEQFSPEELDRIVKGIGGIKEETQKQFDEMGEFARQAGRNIQDALGDTTEQTLRGNFASIGQMWGELLVKMASQALAMKLGNLLFGDMDKTGKVGGWAEKGLDWLFSANGNAFDAGGHISYFANGGVVDRATAFNFEGGRGVMGEAGPEAILPLQRGNDGRLGVVSRGGGGNTTIVNVTVPIQSGVTRAEVAQLVPTIVESVKSSVALSMRRPGNRFAT